MRKHTRTIVLAAVLIAAVAATSALYAQDDHGSSGSMMGPGMMNRDGMMGRGMMGMMQGMSRMMDHCANMMEGADDARRPNDQWRGPVPNTPEQGG